MKSSEIFENLYSLDKEDFKKSEVWIPGYGRMSIQTLEKEIAERLQNLTNLAVEGGPENAFKIKWVLDKGILLLMIDALNKAYLDLRKIKRSGGKRSKNIPNF